MPQPISLLALNEIIRDTLDMHLEPHYWVVAEIAQLTFGTQGHAYMDLVEKNGNKIAAKMRANCWAYAYRTISGKFQEATGQQLKSGMKVLALVSVTFHELYGFSLNVKDIDPNFTLGERARKRQEVIERLQKEGLMETNKTLTLPSVPQKIAIISSVTAAGYGDFINQIDHNRFGYCIHHNLYQATLQGSDAVSTLIMAFNKIALDQQQRHYDAIVLIRGGGAQLDLDCFDEYDLAVTIANSGIPVITGIGHERDETIADLVAHTRMKTPTAAAEFILSGFQEFEGNLTGLIKRIDKLSQLTLKQEDSKLTDLKGRIQLATKATLQQKNQFLNYKKEQILSQSKHLHSLENIKLINYRKSLKLSVKGRIQKAQTQLIQLEKEIKNLNPASFFEKGYTRTEIGNLPLHLAKAESGKEMVTYSLSQKISSTIHKVEKHGK